MTQGLPEPIIAYYCRILCTVTRRSDADICREQSQQTNVN